MLSNMEFVTIDTNEKGAIIGFTDGTRFLVNVKQHQISSDWAPGTSLNMVRGEQGFNHPDWFCHKTKEECVEGTWLRGNDRIL